MMLSPYLGQERQNHQVNERSRSCIGHRNSAAPIISLCQEEWGKSLMFHVPGPPFYPVFVLT